MSRALFSSLIHLYTNDTFFLLFPFLPSVCFSITKVPLVSILHTLISISCFLLPLTLSSTRRRVHFPCPPFPSTFCLKHSSICPLNVLCPCVSRLWHILNLSPLPRMSFGRPAALRQLHSHSSFPHPSTPPHPPASLPDTSLRCVLSGCVYLPLHSAVFTASIHLCLFSPAAPSYIKSGRDITHTQTHIHNHPDARI